MHIGIKFPTKEAVLEYLRGVRPDLDEAEFEAKYTEQQALQTIKLHAHCLKHGRFSYPAYDEEGFHQHHIIPACPECCPACARCGKDIHTETERWGRIEWTSECDAERPEAIHERCSVTETSVKRPDESKIRIAILLAVALDRADHLHDCSYGSSTPEGDFCDCGLAAHRKDLQEGLKKLL